MGNVENAATKILGHNVFLCDVNAPVGMDNLAKPTGVIMEAEQLMAEACNADKAFFLINGNHRPFSSIRKLASFSASEIK